MDFEIAYALYLSYSAWLRGEPLTVDEYITVTREGFDPAELEADWEDGAVPELDEIVDPEDDD
jgi:hypothetical protein